jgi:hypothetical protein
MPEETRSPYYVLDSANPKRMLLGSLEDPSLDDSWLYGAPFSEPPTTPVIVGIIPGYERAELLPYFGTPPVMSDKFYEALVSAGVDNLVVYDAVLTSEDDKIQYEGFKAFNVIGLVKAVDLGKSVFSADNESRLVDAGVERLAIDPKKAKGLLMFRLAEYAGAVIVHEAIKQAIEKHNFPHVIFREPEDFMS